MTAAVSASVFLASASTMAVQPAAAAVGTLDDAIVQVSESSYPILTKLQGDKFRGFSNKIADLVLTSVPPEKLGKSINLAIDVLDSAPKASMDEFNGVLKESFANLQPDSCTLVPLPSMAAVDKFKTAAQDKVDASKLQTFEKTWAPLVGALSKTENSICLPPVEALDKLSLAQANLGRSFGQTEAQAFTSFTGPALKQSIPLGKVFPLLGDAKMLAPTATAGEKVNFIL